jgi:hypothetical protein
MTTKPEFSPDDTWDIGGFFLILMRMWWVVLTVLTATLLVALALWLVRDESEPVYKASTSVMVVIPVSASGLVLSQPASDDGPEFVTNLSVDTLTDLASAKDLLQIIIDEINLENDAGAPISVDTLDSLMDTTVGFSDPNDTLPILTTTVRGDDPSLVARIAATWASEFTAKNGEFVALIAAGSYDFALAQFDFAVAELDTAVEAKQSYEQTRETEFLALTDKADAAKLILKRSEYESALALILENDSERLALKKERQDLSVATRLDGSALPIAIIEIELNTALNNYEEILTTLETNRTILVKSRAQLENLKEALSNENPTLTLNRNFSDDALLALLAENPTAEQITALNGTVIVDEITNPLYESIKEGIFAAEQKYFVAEEENKYFIIQAELLSQQIADLSLIIKLDQLDVITFNKETEQLLIVHDKEAELERNLYTEETSFISLQLSNEAERLRAVNAKETLLTVTRFDQEIEILRADVERRNEEKTIVEIAIDKGAGGISLVADAVIPTNPIPATDPTSLQKMLMIGVIAGIILGTVMAQLVHRFQVSGLRRTARLSA